MKKLSKIAALCAASAMALSIPAPAHAGDNPWVGEMITVGFNFCPRGWSEAAGQLLPISQNSALFSLLGTTFGGDGRTTFGLPDLRGRSIVGMHRGPGLSDIRWGEKNGRENVTLTLANLPSHNHTGTLLSENTAIADTGNPKGNTLGATATSIYSNTAPPNPTVGLHPGSLAINNNGGSQAFNNRNPYMGMLNCIALFGTYPSRS